jgi:sulfoxide reductase heme-binding subunit YedZ
MGARQETRQRGRPHRTVVGRRTVRRLRNHLVLAVASGLLVAAIVQAFSAPFRVSLSGATAYASLLLLAVTLLLGPANVVLGRPNPVSIDIRRDCGVWAAGLGMVHTGLELWRPFQGAVLRVFVEAPGRLRLDSPVLANDTGLAATLLLALLLALSNDRSLRWLRPRRWKTLQRLSYLLFAAAVVHTLLYQRLVQPGTLFVFLLPVLVSAVLALQLAGWMERRQRRRAR